MCAKYRVEDYSLGWDWNGGRVASQFISSVGALWRPNSVTAKFLSECLGVVLGSE